MNDPHDRLKPTFSLDIAAIAILVTTAIVALAQSWGRWLEPVIDTGRDLYIPMELASGATLYVDYIYFYPPLAPLLLAMLTAVPGPSLMTYTMISIAVATVLAFVIWSVARRLDGSLSAFAAVFLFLSVSLTGASTWGANFIFPYSWAATFGVMFFLLFLDSSLRYFESHFSPVHLALATTFGLAASWTKLEMTLAVLLTALAGWILWRAPIRHALLVVLLALVSLGAVHLRYADNPEGHHWLTDNVLSASRVEGGGAFFYGAVSGFARPGAALADALIQAVILTILGLLLVIASRSWRTPAAPGRVAAAIAIGGFILLSLMVDTTIFRGWTILHLPVIAWAVRSGNRPLALTAVASFASTLRIALNLEPGWYGFSLLLPTFIVFAVVLTGSVAAVARAPLTIRVLTLLPFLVIGVRELTHQRVMYELKSVAVRSDRGTYFDIPSRGASVAALIEALREEPAGTLLVIPEGLAINYLAKRPTAIAYHTFTPPETADRRVEQRIIRALEASPPDLIVAVPRDMREFGSSGFGVDYNHDMASWIARNYGSSRIIGTDRFPIALLRRNVSHPDDAPR